MASKVPAQSQRMHNFDLPPLKQSKENQPSPRERLRLSPLRDSASAQPMRVSSSHSRKPESENISKSRVCSSSTIRGIDESHKKQKGADGSAAGTRGNGSKILIKSLCKNEKKHQEETRKVDNKDEANVGGGQKKEKRKLSLETSLSQREIEEDIYSLTGSRPNRRPKKRPKNIQKQLDYVFPGSWLASITPDSYKVLFIRFQKLLI